MDKILMHNKLQGETVKPNFFSTPKLEKATVVAFIMGKWLYIGFWTWFPPSGRFSTGLCYVGVGIVDASIVRFANVPVRYANEARYSLCRLLRSTLLCSLRGPACGGYGPTGWLRITFFDLTLGDPYR